MDDVREEYLGLTLARRLEVRGRMAAGWPLTDPTEVRIAAWLARRQARQGWVWLAGTVALAVGWATWGRPPATLWLWLAISVVVQVAVMHRAVRYERWEAPPPPTG